MPPPASSIPAEMQRLCDRANQDVPGSNTRFCDLDYRQRALLSRAIADRESEFTIESHRAWHNVSYPSARADLLELSARGLLPTRKERRALVISPAGDPTEVLRGARE